MDVAMGLMMARARLNHLPAAVTPVATWVGDSTPSLITISSGTSQIDLPLPKNTVVGDTAVFVLNVSMQDASSFAVTAPAVNEVFAPANFASDGSYRYLAAYTYELTAADVSAGSVSLVVNASGASAVLGVVHCPDGVAVSAIGALGIGTVAQGTSGNMTAPGVSLPTSDGVLLYLCDFAKGGAFGSVGSPPTGFTLGADDSSSTAQPQVLCHEAAAAGDTGDVAMRLTVPGSTGSNDWGAVLLALRPNVPAIALTASFPTNLHVGDAVNFDITATLVGGATGTPTITDDVLPDGLSLAATVQVDATHYKATCSGTLTTAEDVTATFGTIGGSVAAKPLVHDFNVTPPGSFQILEQQETTYLGANASITFNNAIEDGDFVFVMVSRQTNGAITVTDSSGTTYTSAGFSSGTNGVNVTSRLSAALAAVNSLTISSSAAGGGSGAIVAYLLRGAGSLTVDTPNVITGDTAGGAVAAGATQGLGNYSTSGAAFVVGAVASYQNGGPTEPWTLGNSALITDVSSLLASGGHSAAIGHAITSGPVANQLFQTVSSATGTVGNDAWMLVPLLIG